MTILKIHDPAAAPEPEAPPPAPPARKPKAHRPYRDPALRCRRCGKKARWPMASDRPLFCTRLCGYLFAVAMISGGRPKE